MSTAPQSRAFERFSLFRKPWLATLPVMVWQAVFYVVPLLLIVSASFWVVQNYQLMTEWTVDNYVWLVTDASIRGAFLASLRTTLIVVSIALVLAFSAAYVLVFKVSSKYRLILMLLLIIPFWTNYLVRAYSWQIILAPNGLISGLLGMLGIDAGSVLFTPVASYIGLIHFITPLMILLIFSALEGLDRRVLEAAQDLRANRFQRFVHVVLPMSRRGVATAVMLACILVFTDYVSPAVLGGQAEIVAPQLVVQAVQSSVDYARGAALAVGMIAVVLVLVGAVGKLIGGPKIGGER